MALALDDFSNARQISLAVRTGATLVPRTFFIWVNIIFVHLMQINHFLDYLLPLSTRIVINCMPRTFTIALSVEIFRHHYELRVLRRLGRSLAGQAVRGVCLCLYTGVR